MFQGFYNLGSSMISQSRNLNVISNNMANAATPGYKSDRYISSTFREELLYRSGNRTPADRQAIGTVSQVVASTGKVTSYEQGGFDVTGIPLDFALNGSGFFVIQSAVGTVYSRNGSFITDEEGYLTLPGVGRVMGTNGPIHLDSDNIVVKEDGSIWDAETGGSYGTIRLVDFENYDQLIKGNNGTFMTQGAVEKAPDAKVLQGMLETSNVSMIDEMTAMMSSQRTLESAAQMIKMYDQLNSKTVQLGSM